MRQPAPLQRSTGTRPGRSFPSPLTRTRPARDRFRVPPLPEAPLRSAEGTGPPDWDARIDRAARFGHDFTRLRVAGPGPLPAPAADPHGVIQGNFTRTAKNTLRNNKFAAGGAALGFALGSVPGALLGGIGGHLADRFWNQKTQAKADARSKELDEAEHALYEQLKKVKTPEERGELMEKLDQLQKQHADHVDYLHQNNLELWTPDRDRMGLVERSKLRKTWDDARDGNQMLEIPQEPEHEEARKQLRAMHARLLSRPDGRKLLEQVLDPSGGEDKKVRIKFSPEDRSTPEERLRMYRNKKHFDEVIYPRNKQQNDLVDRLAEELQRIEEREGRDSEAAREKLRELQEAGDLLDRYQDEEREYKDPRLRPTQIPHPALAEETGLGANWKGPGRPGTGSGATVTLRTGVRDSEQMSHGRDDRPIPSPAFIQYGHELVHVLHYRQGTKGSTNPEHARLYGEGGRLEDYHNHEEHKTIESLEEDALSENALRREHGLPERKGHTGKSREEFELRERGLL